MAWGYNKLMDRPQVEPSLVWKDTVPVRTGETVDILLNVGRWMAAPPRPRRTTEAA